MTEDDKLAVATALSRLMAPFGGNPKLLSTISGQKSASYKKMHKRHARLVNQGSILLNISNSNGCHDEL